MVTAYDSFNNITIVTVIFDNSIKAYLKNLLLYCEFYLSTGHLLQQLPRFPACLAASLLFTFNFQ